MTQAEKQEILNTVAAESVDLATLPRATMKELASLPGVKADGTLASAPVSEFDTRLAAIETAASDKLKEVETSADAAKRALFLDMWKDVGGGYNATTGYYSLNTINDLTYDEAIAILNYGGLTVNNRTAFAQSVSSPKIRTFINQLHKCLSTLAVENIFSYNPSVEVIDGYLIRARNMTFYCAGKLRKIYDLYTLCDSDVTSVLYGDCPMLEEIGFNRTNRASFNFGGCPKLNLATFQNLVRLMPDGTAAVTVTVHPDVYAKLTDTANTDWHKVLTDGAAKSISFATV